MTVLQEIKNKAFTLSPLEKGQLLHDLILNLDGGIRYSGDFEKEIRKRIKKIKSGKAVGISAVDVFSKIEARCR
jgi:ATP-dependent Clp protease ATP-binding subunit ClpA